ncbi:AaceriADR192Cp [[Ashbya] aceris (nom. inval.)]|nr:AaceriADR192Cp [[Ashbya] aceris (nom. inval.)]
MNSFRESDEEDNNPFSGTNHLYASGIGAVPEGDDDFLSAEVDTADETVQETREQMMSRLFGECEGPREGSAGGWTSGSMGSIGVPDGRSDEVTEFGIDTVLVEGEARTPGRARVPTSCTEAEGSVGALRIVDAGQYKDTFGNYAIGYTIAYEGRQVTRRYSEFDSLRQALARLLPTVIIPPIPSKHPLIRYFLNPLNAENDIRIIEKRRRLLSRFLNNCYDIADIREHAVFQKFLNPEYIWSEVLLTPPVSILPTNNLLAPPLNPTKPSPLHLLLPTPPRRSTSYGSLKTSNPEFDIRFAELESLLLRYHKCLQPVLASSRQKKIHFKQLASSLADLGAYYNAFSLEDNVINLPHQMDQIRDLSRAIEKIGQAVDVNYVSSELLVENIMILLEEPIGEMLQFVQEGREVLRFRTQKQQQFHIIDTTIKKRRGRIEELRNYQAQLARLEAALKQNAEESPTIARAVQRLDAQHLHKQRKSPSAELQWTGLFKSRSGSVRTHDSLTTRPVTGDVDVDLLSDEERAREIARLEGDLEKLNECYKLIQRDMLQVNQSMSRSFDWFIMYLHDTWALVLRNFTRTLLNWLKDCLTAWKNARVTIDTIAV